MMSVPSSDKVTLMQLTDRAFQILGSIHADTRLLRSLRQHWSCVDGNHQDEAFYLSSNAEAVWNPRVK